MDQPEQLLSQALRAQASGGWAGPVPAAPGGQRSRLAAGWVLLVALVLGLLAGAVAGLVTVL